MPQEVIGFLKTNQIWIGFSFCFLISNSLFCLGFEGNNQRFLSLKAAYLSHFSSYVKGPQKLLPNQKTRYCLWEIQPTLGPAFSRAIASSPEWSKKIEVIFPKSIEEIQKCHIAYFGKEYFQKHLLDQTSWNAVPILTISEDVEFLKQGGVLRFFVERNRLRFEINLKKGKSLKLWFSSQLLALSRIFSMELPPTKENVQN